MEVTGAVNLADTFHDALPPEQQQDAVIKDACTKLTDAYLAPNQLRNTTLTLIYSTPAPPSWAAGSHQVSCSIGTSLGNGGWSTLVNSAKGPLVINGLSPVAPPPPSPDERLNFPALPPMSSPAERLRRPGFVRRFLRFVTELVARLVLSVRLVAESAGQTAQTPQGDGHMPGQQPGPGPGAGGPASRRCSATPSSTARRRLRSTPRTASDESDSPPPGPDLFPAAPDLLPPVRPLLGPLHPAPRSPGPSRRAVSRTMAVHMQPQRFDELVSDALDLLPPELTAAIDNVVVLVGVGTPRSPTSWGCTKESP